MGNVMPQSADVRDCRKDVCGSKCMSAVPRTRGGAWLCLDHEQEVKANSANLSIGEEALEILLQELFRLHDLKKNGVLEEAELIKLNEKIGVLHHGQGVDKAAIQKKYRALFRENLNADGKPVGYDIYRAYILQVLHDIDKNLNAQEMILEQWIAEADSARAAFFCPALQSVTDAEFRKNLTSKMGTPALLAKQDMEAGEVGSLGLPKGAKPQKYDQKGKLPTIYADEALVLPDNLRSVSSESGMKLLKGDPVEVWSNTSSKWMSGAVLDVYPEPAKVEGYTLPAGTVKVTSPAGQKWVMKGDLEKSIRKASDEPHKRWAGMDVPTPPSASSPAVVSHGYKTGDQVQVWSDSMRGWLDGTVAEAFERESSQEGFLIPPGTLRVKSRAGSKWVLPDKIREVVRLSPPANSLPNVPPPDLHSIFDSVLASPVALRGYIDATWSRFECDSRGMSRQHCPAALEFVARSALGLRMEIEERHLAAVFAKFDTFDLRRCGFLTKAEFEKMTLSLVDEAREGL